MPLSLSEGICGGCCVMTVLLCKQTINYGWRIYELIYSGYLILINIVQYLAASL